MQLVCLDIEFAEDFGDENTEVLRVRRTVLDLESVNSIPEFTDSFELVLLNGPWHRTNEFAKLAIPVMREGGYFITVTSAASFKKNIQLEGMHCLKNWPLQNGSYVGYDRPLFGIDQTFKLFVKNTKQVLLELERSDLVR